MDGWCDLRRNLAAEKAGASMGMTAHFEGSPGVPCILARS
jgi:hypothetical protein